MASPQVTSPAQASFSSPLSGSRSSTRLGDDVTSLTSFNPFSEEDENDQSSYTLVTSIFSRMKNSLAAPLSSAAATTSIVSNNGLNMNGTPAGAQDQKRPSLQSQSSGPARQSSIDRPNTLSSHANPAPPLVSLTPAQSEAPTYSVEYERSPSRTGMFYSESGDGGLFGTSIPGFPIPDDARSIKTTGSLHRSGSVSKVIRRIRGEGAYITVSHGYYTLTGYTGLSRDYWMDDENAKECYDCKSIFTTWRRKHHCRICGK